PAPVNVSVAASSLSFPALNGGACRAPGQAFRVCEVSEKDGQLKARFTDGSRQRWCGDKSYFVGPIQEPVIGQDGKIKSA
ncbi:hypothetical protein, partial [Priestia megaterium]|uniref:hypothetical protein n=1 Tax=Priestia megaterium TaxID=1404 RepID=UPI0035B57F94